MKKSDLERIQKVVLKGEWLSCTWSIIRGSGVHGKKLKHVGKDHTVYTRVNKNVRPPEYTQGKHNNPVTSCNPSISEKDL